MFLHEISFMLALQVDSPCYRIFELDALGNSLFEYPDSFSVRQADELRVDYALKSFDEAVVVFVRNLMSS